MNPAATDGELDIRLAIKERKRYDFRTSHYLYRKPVFAVPPKNEGLERAPQCRLPGPKRTLHSYVAYFKFLRYGINSGQMNTALQAVSFAQTSAGETAVVSRVRSFGRIDISAAINEYGEDHGW